MTRARSIEERHDLVDGLVRLAFGAMPPAKADEFAAYLGHPGFDRRYLNRIAPAVLPAVTIDRPRRKSRKRVTTYVECDWYYGGECFCNGSHGNRARLAPRQLRLF